MEHPQGYLAAGDGKQPVDKSTRARAIKRRLLAAAVLIAASTVHSESQAQQGPFAYLAGSWRGGGTVALDDGSTERIRCHANYAVSGPTMRMTLTCASEAYKFNLAANVEAEGNAIVGTWSEGSRNISGSLRGRGGGSSFQVVASGGGFNADISLRTSGNRQSVVMRADSQFRGANISLSR